MNRDIEYSHAEYVLINSQYVNNRHANKKVVNSYN